MLKEHYTIYQYWKGKRYLGLDFNWDHQNRVVHISILKYVANAIKSFHHKHLRKPQDQPYPQIKTIYGTKAQYSPDADNYPLLAPSDKKKLQEVTVTLLYYARAVDATMLTALGYIATQQANATKNKMKKVTQFLEYASSPSDVIITYNTINMVLAGHSDASYLL